MSVSGFFPAAMSSSSAGEGDLLCGEEGGLSFGDFMSSAGEGDLLRGEEAELFLGDSMVANKC